MSDELKLNQVIAIAEGAKKKRTKEISTLYHKLDAPTLFEGIQRDYHPVDDEGESKPREFKNVQFTAEEAISEVANITSDLVNVVHALDLGNTEARSDIVVDGKVIISNIPVVHILFLEKQMEDLRTFVSKIPELDPAETWTYSDDMNCYKSEMRESVSTKKVFKNHIKAEATDKHPAQVDVYTEDVIVGLWDTVKLSGHIKSYDKNNYLKKIDKFVTALKIAREHGNLQAVSISNIGRKIIGYIFE